MRRRLTFAVLLLAALGLAVTASAVKPPVVKEIPVIVTFADEPGYAIRSDGSGAYFHGTTGVTAVFVSSGNLTLNTGSLRGLWLDFSDCASPGECAPPFAAEQVVAFLSTSNCQFWSPRDMPLGSSQLCSLGVNFGTPGTGWFIRFGETTDTTDATMARTTDGWTIDVPEGGLATLQSYPTKGRMVLTYRGHFVMPVSLTVTLLP